MWTILDLFPGIVLDIMIVCEAKALFISLEDVPIIIWDPPWHLGHSATRDGLMLAKNRVSF